MNQRTTYFEAALMQQGDVGQEGSFTILDVRSSLDQVPNDVIFCAIKPMSREFFNTQTRERQGFVTPDDYSKYIEQLAKASKSTTLSALTANSASDMDRVREKHGRYAEAYGGHIFCASPNSVTFTSPYELRPYELGPHKIHTAIVPALMVLCGEIDVERLDTRFYSQARGIFSVLKKLASN